MRVIKKPSALSGGHACMPLTLKKDTETSADINVRMSNGDQLQFSRDWLLGETTFDLSELAKMYFEEDLIPIDVKAFTTTMQSCGMTIQGGGTNLATIAAVNAVQPSFGPYDFSVRTGDLLTRTTRIYRGYPCILSFALPGLTVSVRINGQQLKDFDGTRYPIINVCAAPGDRIELRTRSLSNVLYDNSFKTIQDAYGEAITVNNATQSTVITLDKIPEEPEPENGRYLMWLNPDGGWDSYMFRRCQVDSMEVSKAEAFLALETVNSSRPMSVGHVHGGVASHSLRVGAEAISTRELDILRSVVWSPFIFLYNKERNEWNRVMLEKANCDKNTWETGHDITFDLALPTQTQL